MHKPNIDWNSFKEYVFKKYAESYARNLYLYAKKYVYLIDNPSRLETFSPCKKNHILKSLIAFSKFHGFYQQFRENKELRNHLESFKLCEFFLQNNAG